jgi:hypothetical protein
MPGANKVWRSALGRASYPRVNRGTHRATATPISHDSNGKLLGTSAGTSMHLATTGPGSSPAMPTAKGEARREGYRGLSSNLPPK